MVLRLAKPQEMKIINGQDRKPLRELKINPKEIS